MTRCKKKGKIAKTLCGLLEYPLFEFLLPARKTTFDF